MFACRLAAAGGLLPARRLHAARRAAAMLGIAVSLSAAGCASVGGSSTAQSNWRSRLFRREPPQQPSLLASHEVPDKLKNPDQLSLAYARLMSEAGNLPEAESHFNKVLEHKPENVDALLGLARVHHLAGRYDAAEQTYLRTLKHSPQSPSALHGLGQVCAARGQWDEAAELLNKAVLAQPNDSAIRYDLAVALVQSDNVPAALPHFINTVGDAEAHYNIGLILHRNGRLRESEQHLRLALSKNPDLKPARQWLETVQREQLSAPPATLGAHAVGAAPGAIQPVSYQVEPPSSGLAPS